MEGCAGCASHLCGQFLGRPGPKGKEAEVFGSRDWGPSSEVIALSLFWLMSFWIFVQPRSSPHVGHFEDCEHFQVFHGVPILDIW